MTYLQRPNEKLVLIVDNKIYYPVIEIQACFMLTAIISHQLVFNYVIGFSQVLLVYKTPKETPSFTSSSTNNQSIII